VELNPALRPPLTVQVHANTMRGPRCLHKNANGGRAAVRNWYLENTLNDLLISHRHHDGVKRGGHTSQ